MQYKFINTSTKDKIFVITLNRPDKHNALHIDMVRELNHCFSELINNSSINAIFIKGNDKAFCAGGDLKEMQQLDEKEAKRRSAYVQSTFKLLGEIKVPVVAFVQGICYGGGLELTMHTDFVICDETARLALPEVKYGMIPGAGGTVQLPLQMMKSDAAYFLLTGNEIPLSKAFNSGLIQLVLCNDEFEQEKIKLASYFANANPFALKAIKERIRSSSNKSLDENYNQESKYFSELLTQQGRTGIEKNFLKNG